MSSLNGNYGAMSSTLGNSSGYDLNISRGNQFPSASTGGGGAPGSQHTMTAEGSKFN